MNTSAFQCSVFISVMVVVVYSASVRNDPSKEKCLILRHIENRSEHLLKLNRFGWVPNIYKGRCTDQFFCLAEKALDNITTPMNVSQHDLEGLQRALERYNNMTHKIHCNLDFKSRYPLPDFLTNVSQCAENRVLHCHKSVR